jgi:hypothetical protein
MKSAMVIAVAVALSATAALAAERRQHEAHEHGHATMHVVLEGEALAIELEAPGMDVVGFEHAPQDANGKAKVWKALALLENASAMFTLPKDAECTVGHVHAQNETMEADGHREDGHKDEDTSKESAAEESGSHSAFHAKYEWRCAHPDALGKAQVHYFKHFSGTDEIEAIIIGPSGQTAQELTADTPDIQF